MALVFALAGPCGYQMMLIDVERLRPGDEVDVTMVWENGGEWTIQVVDPAGIPED